MTPCLVWRSAMIEFELSNRYYTWNNQTVFLFGDWQHLWNGDKCRLFVCKRKETRVQLLESPFFASEEEIPITETVLSELKPISTKCQFCIYCEDILLPKGKFATQGWEHSKQCGLRLEMRGSYYDALDETSLIPDCPCYSDHPLTSLRQEENPKLDDFSKAVFYGFKHGVNSQFISSKCGFPNERDFLLLFDNSTSIYVIDYNEVSDSNIEYNKNVDWTIRAWCEISTGNDTAQVIRSVWDAVFFRSEGTTAICSLETQKLLFLPFGSPQGYYVLSV